MIKIVLLGQRRNWNLERFFVDNLSRQFCVSFFSGDELVSLGRGEDLALFSLTKLLSCRANYCINILTPHFKLSRPFQADATVIASSDDERQLRLLSQARVPVITCGLSSKDTVTFSSKEEENAVVALMRSVKSIYGRIIEPLEVPISFPPGVDDFTLLAYTASLILTETVTSQNNQDRTKYFQS